MTKLKATGWCLIIGMCVVLSIFACGKEDDPEAKLTVLLKDAPGDFQQVNIEVVEVRVHSSAEGWVTVPVNDSIYDLLLLSDSANAVLGLTALSASNISQIRLIIGAQNTVMVDSVIHPLAMSSQDESGLKLNVNQTLASGGVYTLTIDFDANASVTLQGNGVYRLKPVLSAEFQ